MSNMSVLFLLFLLFVCEKGLTSVIQTDQTVMAAVGEEAHFSCQLMDSKDVLQVTWQKMLPDGEKNMATYNKYFGQRVNPDFINKMQFKNVGLQICSIVIRNITEQDEGCYRCLFNTYPDGALSAKTCLQLYDRDLLQKKTEAQLLNVLPSQEPVLPVRESNASEESRVSAAGVTLIVVLLVVLVVCGLAAVVFVLYKQKSKTRDPEKNTTPHKTAKDPHEIVTPLIKMVTDQVKQRTSAKKSPNCPKPSPSTAKCPRKLF